MPKDLKREFVQLIKQACERVLASDGSRGIGWGNDFEIESIELVPAEETETVDYSYSVRREDGTFEDVHKQSKPYEFRVRYWDEFGDEGTSWQEERLGMCDLLTKVGSLLAGNVDREKACNAMDWLRENDTK